MKLTSKQVAKFWRLWGQAEAEVMPHGADRDQRDAYRRSVILSSCGKNSLRDVNKTDDFDRLMYAVASLAGDYQEMSYWCIAGERRSVHMIGACARQIGEIVSGPKGWVYCQATFKQANLPDQWMDIPDTLLVSVFQMLDTHRRRMLKRDHGWRGSRTGEPLGFSPDRIYSLVGTTLTFADPLPDLAATA